MSNRKRQNMVTKVTRPPLPPIINEDDGELPFFKQDFFSDVGLIVSNTVQPRAPPGDVDAANHGGRRPLPVVQGKKLWTARCILAYNSPVFEKQLAPAKKTEIELHNKNYDDVVELLCYLDPRVQYTITAQSAKQLLPLAEEYEMFRLRRDCEIVLYHAYEQLRKDHKLGHMPPDVNEEYLIISDRYKFEEMLQMCIDEYVHCTNPDVTKGIVHTETVSERVKLVILERKLSRLNAALERERKYKYDMENKLGTMSPKSRWNNKFGLY